MENICKVLIDLKMSAVESILQQAIDEEGCGAVFAVIKFADE